MVWKAGVLAFAAVMLAAEPLRITIAANVSVRAEPSTTAPVVAMLPLGTELTELARGGPGDAWYRVRLADAREGWILGTLTRSLAPERRAATLEALVTDRLARQGDGFAARAELADFVERAAGALPDEETRGRFALYRLRALAAAMEAIPFKGGRREPLASWLAAHPTIAIYNEPGGRWILRQDAILRERDLYAGTIVADDMAWLAVTTGLPGECEGDVSCYLTRLNLLEGEYVRTYPFGRHVVEALQRLTESLETMTGTPPPKGGFYLGADCPTFSKRLTLLREAVSGTTTRERETTLAAIDKLEGWCR